MRQPSAWGPGSGFRCSLAKSLGLSQHCEGQPPMSAMVELGRTWGQWSQWSEGILHQLLPILQDWSARWPESPWKVDLWREFSGWFGVLSFSEEGSSCCRVYAVFMPFAGLDFRGDSSCNCPSVDPFLWSFISPTFTRFHTFSYSVHAIFLAFSSHFMTFLPHSYIHFCCFFSRYFCDTSTSLCLVKLARH